jgi:ATP-binding cassette, subfamily B, bacterial
MLSQSAAAEAGEPSLAFQPLEYDYRSNKPLTTLWRLLGRSGWFYLALLVVLVVKHSPVWVIPFLVAHVIDALAAGGDAVSIRRMAGYFGIVLLLVLQNVPMQTLMISMLSGAVRGLEQTLRNALVTRLQQLSIAFHDRVENGRLQAKVLRDVEQIQHFCMMVFEGAALAGLSVLFAVVVTAWREPWMSAFFVFILPLVVGLRYGFRRRIKERNRDYRAEVERMSADVSEMINMIPVVRAHGLEETEVRRIGEQLQVVNQQGRRLDVINALFGASAFVTFQVAMVITLGVQAWFCLQGWITAGEIVLYQSLFGTMVMSVSHLLNFYPQLARGVESIRSLGEVLECPDLELNQDRGTVESLSGQVRFDGVTFSYGGREANPAVRDISLDIAPGECVALVGESGAGKSTMMQLLIGFRRPQQGRILFDGVSMEALDMRSVRRFISVVPQETMLFSGTIRENILYGLEGVSEEALRQVVAAAQLEEMIQRLPQGLETRIGEDGALLSGGQRQRIAIARALVRDPRILVLDEATSALDVVSERKVQEAIDQAVRHRTTFIVAHRLSTIRRADRIVVMQQGRIVDTGTYQELSSRPGPFQHMDALQKAL